MAAACSCARRARALAYWREEEGDRRAPGGLGRQLGRPGGFGGCQVGIFSLCFLFFLICFCFLIICLCFELRKNTKAFPKILKIFMDTC